MGFPIAEAEEMPDVTANSLSAAFGDFRSDYLVVDRAGVRILRDPYSAKPYVMFYTTKRVPNVRLYTSGKEIIQWLDFVSGVRSTVLLVIKFFPALRNGG